MVYIQNFGKEITKYTVIYTILANPNHTKSGTRTSFDSVNLQLT